MINLQLFSTGGQQALWIERYGPTLRYLSISRRREVLCSDLTSIRYIYAHPEVFDL